MAHSLSPGRRVAVAAVAAVLLLPTLAASPAAATEGTMWVTESTTITADHHGNIVIAADNVTLDCAGHVIGGGGTGVGIELNGRSHVTITNCVVRDFSIGIYLGYAGENTIATNSTSGNGLFGVLLEGSAGNTLSGNLSTSNFYDGFQLTGASDQNVLTGNTATSNGVEGGAGFVVRGSTGNVLKGNTANDNLTFGFLLEESSNNRLEQNVASKSPYGFYLAVSNGNSFVKNSACHNVAYDYFQDGSSSNNVFDRNEFCTRGGL